MRCATCVHQRVRIRLHRRADGSCFALPRSTSSHGCGSPIVRPLFNDPEFREQDTSDLDDVEADPLEFTEPWKTIFLKASSPNRAARGVSDLYQGALYAGENDEDVWGLMIEIEAVAAPIHYPTLAEMAADLKPISWLWEH